MSSQLSVSDTAAEAIRGVLARLVHRIDAQRWSELEPLFAQSVDMDYTSLFGGAPKQQAAEEIVAGWRKLLSPLKTQHLLGPIEVNLDGNEARAECHVRASHYSPKALPGGDEWTVVGHYSFALTCEAERWRIARMTLELTQQIGNGKLLEEATQ